MNRTFPDNVRFRKSADPCLQKTLYNVLVAYGRHNQGVGYCQVSPRGGGSGQQQVRATPLTGSQTQPRAQGCDLETLPG